MKFLLNFVLLLTLTAQAANVPSDEHVLLSLGQPTRTQLPSKKIRILVWNLHKGSNKDFEKDFTTLAQGKDLIISQEILLNSEMKRIFSKFSDYLFSTATSFLVGPELTRTGVGIGTEVPFLSSHFLRTKNVEPITLSPKITLINQYPVDNDGHTKLLTVINLHAINFVAASVFQEEMDRISQLILSRDFLDHPLLITGDFNTWSKERMEILNNLKNNLLLEEAIFDPDFRLTFNGFPLDHVLFSKHLKLISAKADKSYQGSDHRPLELIFDLK